MNESTNLSRSKNVFNALPWVMIVDSSATTGPLF